ncbi:MAG: hypothetical protein EOM91_15270 [Sphingobacteriia bacterium]|nr:hypothetical protein [Sphingobacteriia bacterium]NCC41228.1 hypothetical protein [Gammaproteobacteria bacterium]
MSTTYPRKRLRCSIWERILPQESALADEFGRDFIRSEFAEIVDRMGIDSEDDYLTTVRSGRPRIGRAQRKSLWRLFSHMQRELANSAWSWWS